MCFLVSAKRKGRLQVGIGILHSRIEESVFGGILFLSSVREPRGPAALL